MSSSLSNLADNLSYGLHNIKRTDCKYYLEYISTETDNHLIFRCFDYKRSYKKDFNKDFDKFILLIRKGVYPYEYMDSWERFDKKLLPKKENFYSSLNMEDVTDVDYRQVEKVWKDFKIKNIGVHHDFYVESDTLLLSDVFENFRDKCIGIYEIDPAYFLSAPGLAWEACLKKTEIRLELLTDINMFLMVEKRIGGGICHAIHRYAKANNKYMKKYDKNIKS